jgi:serpin B
MRFRTVAAMLALAPLVVAGCGSQTTSSPPQARPTTPVALPTTLVGNVERLHPGSLTAQDIATSQQKFGLDLLAKVCGKDGPNTLLSPASAADALGMLDAAAQGATASSMSKLLHLPTWGPAVVSAVHDHRVGLAALSVGNGDTLRVSNRVWPATSIRPTQQFLDDVRTAYGASLRTLDFAGAPGKATDAINAQVGKDTDGLIPTLFDQPLDSSTAAVLTNAIVLKAQWLEPFLERQTTSPFITPAGTKQVLLMDSAKPAGYSSAGGWQAAQIAYSSGTMAAVLLLPPKNAAPCAQPTAAQLAALTATSTSRTDVAMPKLHLDQTHDLLATLAGMGLPRNGDFGGLDASIVSRVVQKDVMTVDELGTVAAGATGVAVEASAAATPQHSLVFDRPYLLMLEDTATQTPLFLASVGDPTAS